MRKFALTLVFLVFAPAFGQDPLPAQPHTFPASWLGTWAGQTSHVKNGKATMTFRTELHVAPLGNGRWQWRITYGAGERASSRPYELVADAQQPGHFRIDEKNGIVLNAYLENDRLHARFAVGENCIGVTYARNDDAITMTLRTFGTRPVATTGGGGKTPQVQSFALRSVQRGVLKRVSAQRD